MVARVLGVPRYRRTHSHPPRCRDNYAGAAFPERQISDSLIAFWIQRRYHPIVSTGFIDRLASQLKIGKDLIGWSLAARIMKESSSLSCLSSMSRVGRGD